MKFETHTEDNEFLGTYDTDDNHWYPKGWDNMTDKEIKTEIENAAKIENNKIIWINC